MDDFEMILRDRMLFSFYLIFIFELKSYQVIYKYNEAR